MTKGSVHQENIRILCAYAPENRSLGFMMQKLTGLQGVMQNCIQSFQHPSVDKG